jgi:hypothetical protein
MTDTTQQYAALSGPQKSLYDEAVSCGATHNDAMEAALTDGYTHLPELTDTRLGYSPNSTDRRGRWHLVGPSGRALCGHVRDLDHLRPFPETSARPNTAPLCARCFPEAGNLP